MKPPAPRRRDTWLPHPVLSAAVAAAWLLLQQSVAPAQLLVAAVVGLAVPWLLRGFLRPEGPPSRRAPGWAAAWPAVRLAAVVLGDVVRSNFAVARLVLAPAATPRPAWIALPLELDDPLAVTLLAAIITTTPGTISCVVDEARREILVHALDCDDPAALVAQIKRRYERPLREIFE